MLAGCWLGASPLLLREARAASDCALGEARPRPCRVQRVIVCFRLCLWLFWVSNYKDMKGLDRQELVEKPAWWGGNRGTQITNVFEISFGGKASFLVSLLAAVRSQPPTSSQPQVICKMPWTAVPASQPHMGPSSHVHCQPLLPKSPF